MTATTETAGSAEHGLIGTTADILPVSYPEHWFAPTTLLPPSALQRVEEETLTWMSSLGLLPTPQHAAGVRAMEPRRCVPCPMADYEQALTISKFYFMWLLWDDMCVERATSHSFAEQSLRALAGQTSGTGRELGWAYRDPFTAAWRHVGDEFERLGASHGWRGRLAGFMAQWVERAVDEAKIRRTGAHLPAFDFSAAVRLRAETIGPLGDVLPAEFAARAEVPEDIQKRHEYRALIEQVGHIIGTVNDCVGVAKDIEANQQQTNLVLLHHLRFETPSLRDSYAAVLEVHDQAVRTYDALARRLLRLAADDVRQPLGVILDSYRYVCTGFNRWHTEIARYQAHSGPEQPVSLRLGRGGPGAGHPPRALPVTTPGGTASAAQGGR